MEHDWVQVKDIVVEVKLRVKYHLGDSQEKRGYTNASLEGGPPPRQSCSDGPALLMGSGVRGPEVGGQALGQVQGLRAAVSGEDCGTLQTSYLQTLS